jgi:hypothetical protein
MRREPTEIEITERAFDIWERHGAALRRMLYLS